jgi:hypothetical protein
MYIMSEKAQHTAANTREKMQQRYGDDLYHKHNKNHTPFRLHSPSHPNHVITDPKSIDEDVYRRTGQVRAFKLRKIRKRLDKGRIH